MRMNCGCVCLGPAKVFVGASDMCGCVGAVEVCFGAAGMCVGVWGDTGKDIAVCLGAEC